MGRFGQGLAAAALASSLPALGADATAQWRRARGLDSAFDTSEK
jgi:hypothetical protein